MSLLDVGCGSFLLSKIAAIGEACCRSQGNGWRLEVEVAQRETPRKFRKMRDSPFGRNYVRDAAMPNDHHVYRTEQELSAAGEVAEIFARSSEGLESRLDNFPKYARRVPLKRFLAMYEIFKRILEVKGSIIELGVFRGFGVMTWAKLSAILEPENLTRRIYGFDTFAGFPAVSASDTSGVGASPNQPGDLCADSYQELQALIREYDRDRYLGHIPKVSLVKGDIVTTVPAFLSEHPHVLVSLLFVDCDLHEPTLAGLKAFLPRMPKGAVVAFDELDNPKWPGETLAMLEQWCGQPPRLERLEWDPYIAFARIE